MQVHPSPSAQNPIRNLEDAQASTGAPEFIMVGNNDFYVSIPISILNMTIPL